jgi:hypothetical protein
MLQCSMTTAAHQSLLRGICSRQPNKVRILCNQNYGLHVAARFGWGRAIRASTGVSPEATLVSLCLKGAQSPRVSELVDIVWVGVSSAISQFSIALFLILLNSIASADVSPPDVPIKVLRRSVIEGRARTLLLDCLFVRISRALAEYRRSHSRGRLSREQFILRWRTDLMKTSTS